MPAAAELLRDAPHVEPALASETGAAIVHATFGGEPLPRMIWPSNYSKLAAATMFTLFFGGNDFAPLIKIEGEPAQDYLQRHFIDAMKQVAQRVTDLPNVVGFNSFNERSPGYLGVQDLTRHINILRVGAAPTPFESMLLGAGFSRQIDVYEMSLIGPRKRGRRLINPQGVSQDESSYELLQKAGATEIVPVKLEASLIMASQLLSIMGMPMARIVRRIQELRNANYGNLRQFFQGEERFDIDKPDASRKRLNSIVLTANAYAVGKTLHELDLNKFHASLHNNLRGPDSATSASETPLKAGDTVVLFGTPEELEHAEA